MRPALIVLLLAGVAAPALAQSADPSIPGRVDKLEHEMRAVQRKVFPGANPDYFEPQITPPAAPPHPPSPRSPAGGALATATSGRTNSWCCATRDRCSGSP